MKTDVLIIGAGPGGTCASMFLADRGIRSMLVEKEDFPRYHVGESMTGECAGVIRALGLEETMLARSYPLKRGVTVYGTDGKNAWYVPVRGRSSNWELSDKYTWQVPRNVFDRLMLDEATSRGVELVKGQALEPILAEDGGVAGANVLMPSGQLEPIAAEVVIDASGQSTFLANLGITGPKFRGSYDRQIAIFSQVASPPREEGLHKNDTLIFYQQKYQWAWYIPLEEDIVSVGVVVPAAYFKGKGESKPEFLVREIKELNPELAQRLPEVKLVEDVRATVNYSYQVQDFGGRGFLCIGDAHRFVDPVFSFGLFVTMKEAQFAAKAIERYLEGHNRDDENPFASHILECEMGIDILEDVIDAFWEFPLAFARLVHVRYPDLMVDLFAGRVFDHQPSEAVQAMRKLLGRERSYENGAVVSVPLGSRYDPASAEPWELTSDI